MSTQTPNVCVEFHVCVFVCFFLSLVAVHSYVPIHQQPLISYRISFCPKVCKCGQIVDKFPVDLFCLVFFCFLYFVRFFILIFLIVINIFKFQALTFGKDSQIIGIVNMKVLVQLISLLLICANIAFFIYIQLKQAQLLSVGIIFSYSEFVCYFFQWNRIKFTIKHIVLFVFV